MWAEVGSSISRYRMSTTRAFTRVPITMDDGLSDEKPDRLASFHPSRVMQPDIQSNRGLLEILRSLRLELNVEKVQILLVDVGVYDRAFKVFSSILLFVYSP